MVWTSATAFLLAAGVRPSGPAHAQAVTIEQMQQALRERDATIAALEKRIAALEATSATAAATTASSPVSYAQASSLQGG